MEKHNICAVEDRAAKKTEEIVSEWRNRGTPIDERLARLVAAELRKVYEEIEDIKQVQSLKRIENVINVCKAEIARLRAELAAVDAAHRQSGDVPQVQVEILGCAEGRGKAGAGK